MIRWFSILAILALVLWRWDSHEYDKDLEKDHIMETGKTWDDIENGCIR